MIRQNLTSVLELKRVYVEIGDFTTSPLEVEKFSIKDYRIHSKYAKGDHYDMALIKLWKGVSKSRVINLCEKMYKDSIIAVAGMGTIEAEGDFPRVLQEVQLQEKREIWLFSIS